jgi:acetyl-CoA synthetase
VVSTLFSVYLFHTWQCSSGDGCVRDKDGYYWITGRIDDVINVSGHRLGSAELEHALVQVHEKIVRIDDWKT